jgi:hypothetical protein
MKKINSEYSRRRRVKKDREVKIRQERAFKAFQDHELYLFLNHRGVRERYHE